MNGNNLKNGVIIFIDILKIKSYWVESFHPIGLFLESKSYSFKYFSNNYIRIYMVFFLFPLMLFIRPITIMKFFIKFKGSFNERYRRR